MIVKEPFILYEGVIPRKKCEEIIQRGTSSLQKAKVYNPSGRNVRKSNIAWLHDKDLFKLVSPYVLDANTNAGWNYEVSMYESLQFTCYERNGHYGWHADGGSDIHSAYTEEHTNADNPKIGKIRKLSMTLNLTDKNNYEGGNLEFDMGQHGNQQYISPDVRTQGTIIVFPSYIPHQITPVTSGTRYSLVLWALGEPFK